MYKLFGDFLFLRAVKLLVRLEVGTERMFVVLWENETTHSVYIRRGWEHVRVRV